MRLAVVAFPVLSAGDRATIDSIRAKHDPNAARVAPHFTLVFPTAEIGADALAARASVVASEHPPFRFIVRRIVAHPEPESAYLFLVPDEGGAELSALYERLNAGMHERSSTPAFVPHITVARLAGIQPAAALAAKLEPRWRAIEGRVETLSLVDVPETGPVPTRRDIALLPSG